MTQEHAPTPRDPRRPERRANDPDAPEHMVAEHATATPRRNRGRTILWAIVAVGLLALGWLVVASFG